MQVSITKCEDYSEENVNRALQAVLEPLGGLSWVKEGMTVGIKANLVTYFHPDKAATTHPSLLCALVRMLKERGAQVILGDSPGGLYNSVYVNRIYAATGMKQAEAAGAKLNQDFSQKDAHFPEAAIAKDFTYTAWLDQVDAIINFCKLKTHGMMGMSAATKNMFGVIPGTMKPEYHYRFPNISNFSDMIVDLNEYFKTKLSIVDAVIGMEGNGPTAGTPRKIGALAASESSYALDLLCAKLIGIDAAQVPTLQAAIDRGLVPASLSGLDIIGNWQDFCISDYHLVTGSKSLQFSKESKTLIGKLTAGFIQGALASKPNVVKKECIGCRECERICPAKAIVMVDKKPKINRKQCIRCFCCQEFCPKGAMKVKRTLIAKILEP